MKNFAKFEKTYQALKNASVSLVTIPYWCINEVASGTFRIKQKETLKEIKIALNLLRDWLKENFPCDAADAYHSDQFSFPSFFAMLKKYPELAEDNKEKLQSLLNSLHASDLTPSRLKNVPDITEFVK